MEIKLKNLDKSGTDALSFNTSANISFSSNNLAMAGIVHGAGTSANNGVISVSGGGMSSWTRNARSAYRLEGTGTRILEVFHALQQTPGAAKTINIQLCATTGAILWSIFEVSGVSTSGSNGQGALQQRVCAQGTNDILLATLCALANVENRIISFNSRSLQSNLSAENTYTPLHSENIGISPGDPNINILTMWRDNSTPDLTPSCSSQSSTQKWGVIAYEIQIPTPAVSVSSLRYEQGHEIAGSDASTSLFIGTGRYEQGYEINSVLLSSSVERIAPDSMEIGYEISSVFLRPFPKGNNTVIHKVEKEKRLIEVFE